MDNSLRCSKSQYQLIENLVSQLGIFVPPSKLRSIKFGTKVEADSTIKRLLKQVGQKQASDRARSTPGAATQAQLDYLQGVLLKLDRTLDDDELHELTLATSEHLATVISSAQREYQALRDWKFVTEGVPLPDWRLKRGLVDWTHIEELQQKHRRQIEDKRAKEQAQRGVTFSNDLPE
jgi:hypothetical protein